MSSEVFRGLADRMNGECCLIAADVAWSVANGRSGESIPGVASSPDELLAFLDQLKDDIYQLGFQPQITFAFGRKPS
jgi:hypothetical protein